MEATCPVDAHVSNVQVVTCPFSPASCTSCLPPLQGIPVSCGKPPGTGQGLDGNPGAGGESLGLEERPWAWRGDPGLGGDPGPGGETWAWRRDPWPGGETLGLRGHPLPPQRSLSSFGTIVPLRHMSDSPVGLCGFSL